jgi:ankyrin repeat protein
MTSDDDMERTPLHHAAEAGQCEAAAWLLARGADVNAHQEDRIGETPLSLAVRKTHPEMIELLLRNGADPDIPGWMCITARDRALERKRPAGLRMQALIARYAPTVKPRR